MSLHLTALSVVLATTVVLAACAPAAQPPPSAQTTAASQGSDAEWAAVLQGAQREGEVVVAGFASAEARDALTEPFHQLFPGIRVVYEAMGGGRSSALVERVRGEREAGKYLWDIYIGGTGTMITNLKPMGALAPIESALILPDVKDPARWRLGLDFTDRDRIGFVMTPYSSDVMIVNPQLANPEGFSSYHDLLDPRWKGRMLFHDPRINGNGQGTFSFMYQHKDLGPQYLSRLAAQDLSIFRDDRQELDLIAQGRYAVCLGCSSGAASPLMQKGLPLAMVKPQQMREGTYLASGSGNVAMFQPAPHPNAARCTSTGCWARRAKSGSPGRWATRALGWTSRTTGWRPGSFPRQATGRRKPRRPCSPSAPTRRSSPSSSSGPEAGGVACWDRLLDNRGPVCRPSERVRLRRGGAP
jgi:iron(III) transport system substrate-binding protein